MKKRNLEIIFSFLTLAFFTSLSYADCFDDAASLHKVNSNILRAIAKVESNYNPKAIGYNNNGTRDLGLMQINSMHLPVLRKFGITENHLYDGCTSVYIGAWIYKQNINTYGNTWHAVGAYNSSTPYYRDIYERKVYKALVSMGAVQMVSN